MEKSDESIILPPAPTGRIYTARQAQAASGLGGPLTGAYIIAQNFKDFGEMRKVWITWGISVLVFVSVFYSIFFAPFADRVPNVLFPLVFSGIAYFTVRVFQAKAIDDHISKGGMTYGWVRTILVSIIGTGISIAILAGVLFFTLQDPLTRRYGSLGHEIVFYEVVISPSEVDALGKSIDFRGLNESDGKWYLSADKDGSTYFVSFSVLETSLKDPEFLDWIAGLRREVQKDFPKNKIVFNLVTDDFNVIKKRIR